MTDISSRPLFEDGLDIILSRNLYVNIINKLRSHKDFVSMTTITQGRNAFGIIGKPAELKKICKQTPFANSIELRCAHEELLYTEEANITKNQEIMQKWKVFTSKGNGGAGTLNNEKAVAVIGKAYIGGPQTACTDSLFPIGNFDTEIEAINLQKYMETKFLRFIVGILKVSQNITQAVYKFVPIQDFTSTSDIDWSKSIKEIDQQLYKKYNFTVEEIDCIEKMVKEM